MLCVVRVVFWCIVLYSVSVQCSVVLIVCLSKYSVFVS